MDISARCPDDIDDHKMQPVPKPCFELNDISQDEELKVPDKINEIKAISPTNDVLKKKVWTKKNIIKNQKRYE